MVNLVQSGRHKIGRRLGAFLALVLAIVTIGIIVVGPSTPRLLLRAYLYGLPEFDIARARDLALEHQHQAINSLVHKRALSDPSSRLITTPNNDTLYSSGFLDLSAGPVAISVPKLGSRYYSLAFIDAYTNNFAVLGTRTIGGQGATILLTAADWHGEVPPGDVVVRAPTPQVWLLVRILVDGTQDLDAVHKLQNSLVVSGPKQGNLAPIPVPPGITGPDFVRIVDQVLAQNPPPPADAPELQALQTVGIAPGAGALSLRQRLIWRIAFPILEHALIKATAGPGSPIDGWSYTRPSIGDFGTDYGYRAAVALRGLLALPEREAIYTNPVADANGQPLDGAHRYRLHLPKGTPPAQAFWSLTAYEVVADGGLYLYANPLQRYSVGDRTEGLIHNADGSLDLIIQHDRPAGALAANWLPIPSERFALVMRAYLPSSDFLAGRFHYPALERLD